MAKKTRTVNVQRAAGPTSLDVATGGPAAFKTVKNTGKAGKAKSKPKS